MEQLKVKDPMRCMWNSFVKRLRVKFGTEIIRNNNLYWSTCGAYILPKLIHRMGLSTYSLHDYVLTWEPDATTIDLERLVICTQEEAMRRPRKRGGSKNVRILNYLIDTCDGTHPTIKSCSYLTFDPQRDQDSKLDVVNVDTPLCDYWSSKYTTPYSIFNSPFADICDM